MIPLKFAWGIDPYRINWFMKRYPVYKGLIKVCANFVICKYERTQHTSVIFVILSTRLFVYFPIPFFFFSLHIPTRQFPQS